MITGMRGIIEQVSKITHMVDESASVVSATSQQVSAGSNEITRAIQDIAQGARRRRLTPNSPLLT